MVAPRVKKLAEILVNYPLRVKKGAYPCGGGKNKSVVHRALILDWGRVEAFYLNRKCIQKNGKFTFKL